MALQFPAQMTARSQMVRENYEQNQDEYRQIARYASYILVGVVTARLIIEISRHISFLMPLGIMAALLFSAFELALAVTGFILGGIVLAAAVGLGVSTGLRLLHIRR